LTSTHLARFSLLAALAAGLPAAAQEAPLEIGAAVEEALEANPELRRVRELVTEASETRREVRAEALPQLSLDANAYRWRDPGFLNSPNFEDIIPPDGGGDGTGGGGEFDPSLFYPIPVTQFELALRLEQPVFTWGRIPAALRAARRFLDGVQLDVQEAELEVARGVVTAYWGLQLARRRVEVFESERESREAQLGRAEDLLAAGAGTRLDVLQAQVELTNLEPRILQARNEEDQARARLNEAMGRPVTGALALPPADLESPAVKPPSLGELVRVAETHRPALLRFPVDRYVIDQQIKIRRADLRPSVDLQGAYGTVAIEPENLTKRAFESWRVGLFATWNFYDGSRTGARIGQLVSQRTQIEYAETAFRLEMERRMEVALGNWSQATAAREASGRAVELAREAKRIADESYVWGAATSLDVLTAEINLRQAELTQAQAVHDQAIALAELATLSGIRADRPLPFPEPAGEPAAPTGGESSDSR
jgi:HAE1 family hydrophobic/amphiphilic exporter-1